MKQQIHIQRQTECSYVGKTFVVSDLHAPFHHLESIEWVKKRIKSFQPDRLIINGDAMDCFLASRFVENTVAMHVADGALDIADEVTVTRELLDSLADECPDKCELISIPGNHELRIARQLDKARHLIGKHDPVREMFATSRHKDEDKHWFVSRDFPHGRFVICDDPNNRIVVKHAGKGTGHNYASATWEHGRAINESYIIGDTHKTSSFEGRCASKIALKDNRFCVGLGFFGDLSKTGFQYIEETSAAYWDRSVAEISQTADGLFTLDVIHCDL